MGQHVARVDLQGNSLSHVVIARVHCGCVDVDFVEASVPECVILVGVSNHVIIGNIWRRWWLDSFVNNPFLFCQTLVNLSEEFTWFMDVLIVGNIGPNAVQ